MNRFSSLVSTSILTATIESSAHRFTAIAAFVLLLALTGWAQRGGGGRGAGSAGRVGIAGSHVENGSRVGNGSSSRATPDVPSPSAHPSHLPSRGPGHSHGSNDRFQSWYFGRNGFPNCGGYGCWNWAYPWWAYYPYWGVGYGAYNDHEYDHDDNSADEAYRERPQDAQMAPPWQSYGYPYPYIPPPPTAMRAADGASQVGTPIIPPAVLVFRDGHKQEVQSYVIVRQTLWNFTAPQRIEKISLTDLDLPATVKANNERGRSFSIPSTRRSASNDPPISSNT